MKRAESIHKEFFRIIIPQLRKLNEATFDWFYKTATVLNLEKGEVIFNKNSPCEYFYIICNGECISKPDVYLKENLMNKIDSNKNSLNYDCENKNSMLIHSRGDIIGLECLDIILDTIDINSEIASILNKELITPYAFKENINKNKEETKLSKFDNNKIGDKSSKNKLIQYCHEVKIYTDYSTLIKVPVYNLTDPKLINILIFLKNVMEKKQQMRYRIVKNQIVRNQALQKRSKISFHDNILKSITEKDSYQIYLQGKIDAEIIKAIKDNEAKSKSITPIFENFTNTNSNIPEIKINSNTIDNINNTECKCENNEDSFTSLTTNPKEQPIDKKQANNFTTLIKNNEINQNNYLNLNKSPLKLNKQSSDMTNNSLFNNNPSKASSLFKNRKSSGFEIKNTFLIKKSNLLNNPSVYKQTDENSDNITIQKEKERKKSIFSPTNIGLSFLRYFEKVSEYNKILESSKNKKSKNSHKYIRFNTSNENNFIKSKSKSSKTNTEVFKKDKNFKRTSSLSSTKKDENFKISTDDLLKSSKCFNKKLTLNLEQNKPLISRLLLNSEKEVNNNILFPIKEACVESTHNKPKNSFKIKLTAGFAKILKFNTENKSSSTNLNANLKHNNKTSLLSCNKNENENNITKYNWNSIKEESLPNAIKGLSVNEDNDILDNTEKLANCNNVNNCNLSPIKNIIVDNKESLECEYFSLTEKNNLKVKQILTTTSEVNLTSPLNYNKFNSTCSNTNRELKNPHSFNYNYKPSINYNLNSNRTESSINNLKTCNEDTLNKCIFLTSDSKNKKRTAKQIKTEIKNYFYPKNSAEKPKSKNTKSTNFFSTINSVDKSFNNSNSNLNDLLLSNKNSNLDRVKSVIFSNFISNNPNPNTDNIIITNKIELNISIKSKSKTKSVNKNSTANKNNTKNMIISQLNLNKENFRSLNFIGDSSKTKMLLDTTCSTLNHQNSLRTPSHLDKNKFNKTNRIKYNSGDFILPLLSLEN